MAKNQTIRAAVLGASGYTGADMIRLAALHPGVTLTALIAKGHAGQSLAQVFPHLTSLDLPKLVTPDEADWDHVDVVFCGLPHGTAHAEIGKLPKRIKVVDLSADFRLRDPKLYAEWYANEHSAPARCTRSSRACLPRRSSRKARSSRCRAARRTATRRSAWPSSPRRRWSRSAWRSCWACAEP